MLGAARLSGRRLDQPRHPQRRVPDQVDASINLATRNAAWRIRPTPRPGATAD